MQNNRQRLGLLLILIGLLVLILAVYFLFPKKSPVSPVVPGGPGGGQLTTEPVNGTTTPGDRPTGHRVYDISKEKPHVTNATDLEKIGMSFAERFGSYSNQSNYSNFEDLKIFMTDNMKDWVDSYVASLKKGSAPSTSYAGQETRALSAQASSFDDKAGTALVVVTVARSLSTDQVGGGTPQAAKLDLNFKKIDGRWLVDKAYWEKK